MSQKLSTEIQKAIKEQLPNMVAIELETYIKQAEVDKINLITAKAAAEALDRQVSNLQEKLGQLEALELTQGKLNAERVVIEEDKRNLRVTLAEARAEAAQAGKSDIYNLVHGLFRNIEFRKNLKESVPIASSYSSDYNGQKSSGTSVSNYDLNKQSTEEQV